MPSIKEVMQHNQAANIAAAQPVEVKETPTPEVVETPAAPEPTPAAASEQPAKEEDFATCWKTLFDELFINDHMMYYSLKDETPEYKDDTIFITLKNNIQKDLFETRKKSILEFWRNHYTLNVDDIEFIVNEQKEEKVVIINSDDKLKNMQNQNPQLAEFLQILNFSIQD